VRREAKMPTKVCRLLAVQIDTVIEDGDSLVVTATEEGLTVHLDLVTDDLDAVTAEVEQPGGRWLGPGATREL
jgi:hypothetical protein